MVTPKTHGTCSQHHALRECGDSASAETVQPFPKGKSAFRINRTLSELSTRLAIYQDKAYSYVVTSVQFKNEVFEQHGSAPNFQGGVLTLCTCKHQMRTRLDVGDWHGNWVAGFSSRCLHDGKHWLFYLMKVEEAYDSHSDLWNGQPESVRVAKAAHRHFLGDVFIPKKTGLTGDSRFEPARYHRPRRHAHISKKHPTGWHNDINYQHADRAGRQPPLLVGKPSLTFIWNEPMLSLSHDHCRDYSKWASLQDIIARLKEGY
jgi:hypothetical protein